MAGTLIVYRWPMRLIKVDKKIKNYTVYTALKEEKHKGKRKTHSK